MKSSKAYGFFPRAEFEPQSALWLAWASNPYKSSLSINYLQLEMIRVVSPYQKVYVICNTLKEKKDILFNVNLFPELSKQNIFVLIIEFEEFWLRDNGPSFVVNASNDLGIVHTKFNFWGYESTYSPDSLFESQLSQRIAIEMEIKNNIYSDMISEGGGHDFDGKGSMLIVSAHERERNPNWSLDMILSEYRRVFSQINFIVVSYPSIYDDK